MNWSNGFSARYYCTVVDTQSWRDLAQFNLISGSVSKTTDSLMESADIVLSDIPSENEVWVRIWLDARQEGDGAHEALFTGLLSVPSVEWDGNRKTYNAELYSVLKPAEDILLPRGWYAPEGLDGAELAAGLLGGFAPVEYDEDAPILGNAIVAEEGETNLTMARKIVDAIGWRIRVTGRGVIQIRPKEYDPAVSFDALGNDVLELDVTDQTDWFSCPNVFRATCNGRTSVARDDDEESPYSTVSRGREIWREDSSANLNTGESLEEYAQRRLREEQSPARVCSYTRRYCPNLLPGDAVRLHYPAQKIDGAFRIRSQQIELGYSARTAEESEFLIY